MTYRFPVVIVREGSCHWAYVPDLPGVYGMGRSMTAAKKDLGQALKLYIEDCLADGDPIPSSNVTSVKVDYIALAA